MHKLALINIKKKMIKIEKTNSGIFVSLKSISRDLGVSRSTIFRVIQKYKKTHNTSIVPGKHKTILGSYVFEKSIFIDWFKSTYIVSNITNSPVNLIVNKKLNNLTTGKKYEH
jgi:hypothetical protein